MSTISQCLKNIQIHVDSRYRNTAVHKHSNEFKLTCNDIKNVKSIDLINMQIPNTFETFCSEYNNNYIKIGLTSNNMHTLTIDNGSFESNDMIIHLNILLTQLNITHGYNFNASTNSNSGCVTISNDVNFIMDFNNNHIRYSLGRHLGYINDEYTGSDSYTSESIISVTGENYIYMYLNDYSTILIPHSANMLHTNIFAKIPISESKFGIIFHTKSDYISKIDFDKLITLNKIHVILLDSWGDRLIYNYVDYSFTLNVVYYE
jgi:hypothetical protein